MTKSPQIYNQNSTTKIYTVTEKIENINSTENYIKLHLMLLKPKYMLVV